MARWEHPAAPVPADANSQPPLQSRPERGHATSRPQLARTPAVRARAHENTIRDPPYQPDNMHIAHDTHARGR